MRAHEIEKLSKDGTPLAVRPGPEDIKPILLRKVEHAGPGRWKGETRDMRHVDARRGPPRWQPCTLRSQDIVTQEQALELMRETVAKRISLQERRALAQRVVDEYVRLGVPARAVGYRVVIEADESLLERRKQLAS